MNVSLSDITVRFKTGASIVDEDCIDYLPLLVFGSLQSRDSSVELLKHRHQLGKIYQRQMKYVSFR